MAKNKEDVLNENLYDIEGKRSGKMVTSIIAVVIVLIWIAIFALLINCGSSALRNSSRIFCNTISLASAET